MALWNKREIKFLGATELLGRQTNSRTSTTPVINSETALRNSGVWAALTIAADLVSSFPVDNFRVMGGYNVEIPLTPFFETPGGPDVDWCEWIYSSTFDLRRLGNTFGLITARDALGYPARIDLWPAAEVSVLGKGADITAYRFRGTEYPRDQVWHEKENTVPGLPVGLSPIAYASWTLGEYASIQQFALDWFGSGAVPSGHLKNTEKKIDPDLSREVKQEFKATVKAGDVFVSGSDWEYTLIKADIEASNWLDAKHAGLLDVGRFLRVPAELIDAAMAGTHITYQNIGQKNLQYLIYHLNPTLVRREKTFSRRCLVRPRYMRFNRGVLLQMDPETQARVLGQEIRDRLRAPSEARALLDLQPYDEEQLAEFDRLFGKPGTKPTNPSGGPLS